MSVWLPCGQHFFMDYMTKNCLKDFDYKTVKIFQSQPDGLDEK